MTQNTTSIKKNENPLDKLNKLLAGDKDLPPNIIQKEITELRELFSIVKNEYKDICLKINKVKKLKRIILKTKDEEFKKKSIPVVDELLLYLNETKKSMFQTLLFKNEKLRVFSYFVIMFALTFCSMLFDFQVSSWWKICFSSLFMVGFISFFIYHIVKVVKSMTCTKKSQLFVVVSHMVLMLFLILVAQIGKPSSIDAKLIADLVFVMICYCIYQFVDWIFYSKILFEDALLRFLLAIGIFGTVIGLCLLLSGINIVLQIALGIDFALVIFAIINSIIFSKISFFKDEVRDRFWFKLCLIIIYAIAIFMLPFYVKWCGLNDSDFNTFVQVYSCVVGGLLTLGGVAWTIRKSDRDRKEEEIKKAKPLFDFSPILDEPIVVSGSKNCFPVDNEKGYIFDTNLLIDNSEHSSFKLKRIFHDQKWFELTANTMVLPNKKLVLSFKFNEPLDIILEVEDALGNLYYYKMELVNIGFLNGKAITRHTIRSLKEVDINEIKKVENNNEGDENE